MNRIPQKVISPIAKPPESPAIIQKLPDPEWTGELQPTIIHPQFSGLTLVTGFRGKGKSSFAEKIDNPTNIVMLDFEDKEEDDAIQQLGMGAYFPVMSEIISKYGIKYDIQTAYDRVLQILDKMPNDRFTTLVIDNAQDFQDGSLQAVRNNPNDAKRFGISPENALTGNYGGTVGAGKHLIKNVLHMAKSKVKCIVVTFQLRPAWANKQPAFNKFKMTDVTVWHELSKLTLVLVDPMVEHFPIPRALVMKEAYSLKKWNPEKMRTEQIRRIPPALPMATPYEIYSYLNNPYDPKNPRAGETVTALELAPFTPTFSNEQLFLLERAARVTEKLGMVGDESSS